MSIDFRFQSILDLRKRSEEERQMELALTLQQVVALRGQRERLLAERLGISQMIKKSMQGALNATQVEQHYRYLYSLDRQIEHLAEEIHQAEEMAVAQRHLLAEAMKERKTLEKLKEQDRRAFLVAYNQKEQETLDDLNIARHARQM